MSHLQTNSIFKFFCFRKHFNNNLLKLIFLKIPVLHHKYVNQIRINQFHKYLLHEIHVNIWKLPWFFENSFIFYKICYPISCTFSHIKLNISLENLIIWWNAIEILLLIMSIQLHLKMYWLPRVVSKSWH